MTGVAKRRDGEVLCGNAVKKRYFGRISARILKTVSEGEPETDPFAPLLHTEDVGFVGRCKVRQRA